MKKFFTFVAAIVAAVSVYATTEYTCAEAYEETMKLTENNKPAPDSVIVVGYITESLSQWSKGQQRFWMADAPDGGRVFQAYYANLPEPYLSEQKALPVGTKLKMGGHLMKYNETAEMKNGWVVELLEVPQVNVDTVKVPSVDIAVNVASSWEVGKTSTDFFIVKGTVKAITQDYQASDFIPGYPGRQSFSLVTYAQDTVEFIAWNCNMKEEVFANDSVEIIGNLQRFAENKVEIVNGKAEVLVKGEHEEAQTITVSKDEAIAIATAEEEGWLSTDIYIVTEVAVDSISYAYNEEKGTQSFYSFGENANFIAYSCKVPREIVVGDVVCVKGKLTNYKGDAEIKNGEVSFDTAVENTRDNSEKAIKRIENGQVIIIRNGVRYNVVGAQVK